MNLLVMVMGKPTDTCPVAELYEKLFNETAPDLFYFVSGACFAVSKENILKRDINFYRKCLELTLTHYKMPWAFERIYRIIFK